MSALASRVLRRYLRAEVVPFVSAPQNPHKILIHGERYLLSNDGGPLGSPEDFEELKDDPRVILGPGVGQFKYLWVMDTDRALVTMWRTTDGNEKVHQRASTMSAKIVHLTKRSQINRVSHAEFLVIERDMKRRAHDNEEALRRYVETLKTETEKRIDQLTQQYFDENVRSLAERAVAAIHGGVIPIGFKPFNERNRDRQMLAHALGQIFKQRFTPDQVENYLRANGIEPDGPEVDIQAVHWAVGDVIEAAYREYLPARETDTN